MQHQRKYLLAIKFFLISVRPCCYGAVELQLLSPLGLCLPVIDLQGKYGFCKLHGDCRYEENCVFHQQGIH